MHNQLDKSTRTWGMVCHLSSILGFIIPLGTVLAPLVVWLTQKDKHPFINVQGKESVNFQNSMLIYDFIMFFSALVLYILIIVFSSSKSTIPSVPPLVWTLWSTILIFGVLKAIFWSIVTLFATIMAYKGQSYRYPFNLRLWK